MVCIVNLAEAVMNPFKDYKNKLHARIFRVSPVGRTFRIPTEAKIVEQDIYTTFPSQWVDVVYLDITF